MQLAKKTNAKARKIRFLRTNDQDLGMVTKLKLAEHVSFTELDDEAVLLDLQSGSYYGLNHVGVALIKALENGHDEQAAVDIIASAYQAPVAQVKQDISALLTDMLERKLLTNAKES